MGALGCSRGGCDAASRLNLLGIDISGTIKIMAVNRDRLFIWRPISLARFGPQKFPSRVLLVAVDIYHGGHDIVLAVAMLVLIRP